MDLWTDAATVVRAVREEKEPVRRERITKKKMEACRRVEKSRNTVFFQCFCGSGGSKSRLAKAAGAEPSGRMTDQELHAAAARSTCRNQNSKNILVSDHFS